MTKNNFVLLVSIIFLIVGVAHALRVFMNFEVQFGNFSVPMWASWIAAIVAFCLSFHGFRLVKNS